MYVLLAAVLSAALCYAVAYPLWYFATVVPHLYTLLIILLSAAAVVFFSVRRFIRTLKKHTSKESVKRFWLRTVFTLLTILILFSTLIFSIESVFSDDRLTALFIFIPGIVLSAFILKLKARYPDV